MYQNKDENSTYKHSSNSKKKKTKKSTLCDDQKRSNVYNANNTLQLSIMFQPPSHLPNISIPLPDTITSDQLNVSQLSRLIQTHFTPSFAPHLIPINVVVQQPSPSPSVIIPLIISPRIRVDNCSRRAEEQPGTIMTFSCR